MCDDEQDQYLSDNPQIESALWSEWVCVVCGWDKIPNPTQEEWRLLRTNFYHGKTPIESVSELKKMRNTNG
jgi:hypothetical protein